MLDQWVIIPEKKASATMRLFCFPYAGGGTSRYHQWFKSLPEEVELCLVQLPGRERRFREPSFQDMRKLTESLSRELTDLMDKPFALYGHSMGAWIGFEFYRQLRREKKVPPVHLFISAMKAPQIPFSRGPSIHELSKEEMLEALKDYKGTPKKVLEDKEFMEEMLPTIKSDFQMLETYDFGEEDPIDCPLSVFYGEEDTILRDDLTAWHLTTRSSCIVRSCPGDHFFIQSAEKEFLQHMARDLGLLSVQAKRGDFN